MITMLTARNLCISLSLNPEPLRLHLLDSLVLTMFFVFIFSPSDGDHEILYFLLLAG